MDALRHGIAATSHRVLRSQRHLRPLARLGPLRLRLSRVESGAHSPDAGWLESLRWDRSRASPQHGWVQRSWTRSPLSCSRVIFATRASKSAFDRSAQTVFSRRVRSLRTQSSLLSGLRSGQLKPIFRLPRTRFSGIDILPHMGRGSAEAEKDGADCGSCCLA